MKRILLVLSVLFLSLGMVSCKKKETEPEVHTHTYSSFIAEVPATEDTEGVKGHYECTGCHKYFDANLVEITDLTIEKLEHTHSYSNWIAYEEATCEAEGVVGHYECTKCHKYFDANLVEITEISIPKAEHELGTKNIGYDATCTSVGQADYKECQNCHKYFNDDGEELETLEIPCIEHEYVLHDKVDASCYGKGTISYYSCNCCEKLFDTNKNEITDITIAALGQHSYDSNDICTTCGLKKGVISVSEVYSTITTTDKFTITAKVVGVTSSYDGGYVYIILKDLVSDDMIGIRRQVAKDGLDGEARELGTGTSYNPTMLFEMGDIVEMPVSLITNTTTTTGGNKGLQYLIYRGPSSESFESVDEFIDEIVIDHDDNFIINNDNYTMVIDSQEDMKKLATLSGTQWQFVVFKGTHENPLHLVCNTTKTSDPFSREYIYPYFGDVKSMSGTRVEGTASPVFSNFGNKYNLSSELSTLLVNRTEYTAADWTTPYTYEGEIYAVLVGGSSYYYHFVVLQNSCIKNDNQVASSVVSASVAKNTFYQAMEKKAEELGISLHKHITSPVGVSGTVCTEDLVKIGIAMTRSELGSIYWGMSDYIGTWKSNTGETVTGDLYSKTYASDDFRNYILSEFGDDCFIGTKGGSLKATTSRTYAVGTSIIAIKGPDNTILVGATNSSIASDVHEDAIKYQEIAKAFKILIAKYNHDDATAAQIEATFNCHAVAAVMLPAEGAPENGYDWFGEDSTVLHYSKNGKDIIITASVWKTMTCITALDYIDDTDLQTEILVEKSELSSISNSALPKYKGGEIVTLEVAFYSMLRHSSNVSPSIIARYVGEKIYKAENGIK